MWRRFDYAVDPFAMLKGDRGLQALRVLLLSVLLAACAMPVHDAGLLADEVVFDTDDRQDYFEVSDLDTRATVERSAVAILPADLARTLVADGPGRFATLASHAQLCPDERFAGQPSAALCSGVLLDWDLVLVAKHCVRSVPLDGLAVVFGFYFAEPGRLATTARDVYGVASIVTLGAASDDFAWLRLDSPVSAPHWPAAVHTQPIAAELGSALTVISATAGLPIKVDQGARVFEAPDPESGRFLASSDTFQGSSGGGAFDADQGLVGILAQGARDFRATPTGCNAVRHAFTREGPPTESYIYAYRAVQALCAVASSPLCSATCEQPCRVPEVRQGVGSCAVRPRSGGTRHALALAAAWTCGLVGRLLQRRRRSVRVHGPQPSRRPF